MNKLLAALLAITLFGSVQAMEQVVPNAAGNPTKIFLREMSEGVRDGVVLALIGREPLVQLGMTMFIAAVAGESGSAILRNCLSHAGLIYLGREIAMKLGVSYRTNKETTLPYFAGAGISIMALCAASGYASYKIVEMCTTSLSK